MKKNENELAKKLVQNLSISEQNIIKNITNSYLELKQNNLDKDISQKELESFKTKILENIVEEFKKIIAYIDYKPEVHEIESQKSLNVFTSEDIQKKNKEITRIFQEEAYNHENDDESIENKSIAEFFLKVAKLSRKAFYTSKKLLANIKTEYIKYKESSGKNIIVKNEESFKKEFSCWVKQKEKEETKINKEEKKESKEEKKIEDKGIGKGKNGTENKIQVEENKIQVEENKIQVEENKIQVEENKIQVEENKIQVEKNEINLYKLYEEHLKEGKDNILENENKNLTKFLSKLFDDLTLMYFHCDLSFPSVNINFKIEENFDSEKMIDFINRGKNRKVNFVILPSLFSNYNYLQNGKFWVFTYLGNDFKFKDSDLLPLEDLICPKKEKQSLENIKKDAKIDVSYQNLEKKSCITINIKSDISEILKNINYEFVLTLKEKKKNQKESLKLITQNKSIIIDKNYEISQCELKLENETILCDIKNLNKTSKNI